MSSDSDGRLACCHGCLSHVHRNDPSFFTIRRQFWTGSVALHVFAETASTPHAPAKSNYDTESKHSSKDEENQEANRYLSRVSCRDRG